MEGFIWKIPTASMMAADLQEFLMVSIGACFQSSHG